MRAGSFRASTRLGATAIVSHRRGARVSDRLGDRPAIGAQPRHHAGAIRRAAVLAHLPFAGQRRDLQPQPDDRPQLRLDEVGRRIADRPRGRPLALMPLRQAPHEVQQPLRLLEESHPTPDMDRDVVPGRHDLPGETLRLIPGWRDIAVGAGEDRQRFLRHVGRPPLGIGPRDMADEAALRPVIRVQHQRQWGRIQPLAAHRDQIGEGRGPDGGVQDLGPILAEMRRRVDGLRPGPAARPLRPYRRESGSETGHPGHSPARTYRLCPGPRR
jgi:hypothetical protein